MYNRSFWLAYAANTMLMVCVSILFRYAAFVQLRGGSELTLGLVVGVGMVGALAMRGVLGVATDRYGARRVWLLSLGVVVLSLLLHWAIAPIGGLILDGLVFVARIILMIGLAGAFGASITFVSLRAPQGRMGEMVGTIGSSGFIGLALGPILGDWLFADGAVTVSHVQRMFLMSAAAACVSFILTFFATRGSVRLKPKTKPRPPMLWLIGRYHPGAVLICAAAMGVAVMLPHTFLQPYAERLEIPRIRTFFIVYAAAAFSVRLLTRHFTDRYGVRFTAQLGFGFMAASMISFTFVKSELLLALPALLGGIAHAFLFPAIVTGGSMSFPARHRGLATTLVLAMFDLANLVGQPLIGGIVEYAPHVGLPGYTTMFACVAGVMAAAALAAMAIGRPAASYHPPAIDHRPKADSQQPIADSRQPTADNQQPIADSR